MTSLPRSARLITVHNTHMSEGSVIQDLYRNCLRRLLQPLAKMCIRQSISIQELIELAKAAFIAAAADEIERNNQKVNVSRLSVMTGLHRRDVMRIYREGDQSKALPGLASRVLAQWEQDERFHTKAGKPRVLSADGDQSEFAQLVAAVSTDVNFATVLFELERLGLVERAARGIKFIGKAQITSQDPAESFTLLARDAEDLLMSVDENVFSPRDEKNLHARTEYDNVAPEHLEEIRRWLLIEGAEFHRRARNFLSKYDRDVNPRLKTQGRARVVVGTFSRAIAPEDIRRKPT